MSGERIVEGSCPEDVIDLTDSFVGYVGSAALRSIDRPPETAAGSLGVDDMFEPISSPPARKWQGISQRRHRPVTCCQSLANLDTTLTL